MFETTWRKPTEAEGQQVITKQDFDNSALNNMAAKALNGDGALEGEGRA